jgi:hypothetical protein
LWETQEVLKPFANICMGKKKQFTVNIVINRIAVHMEFHDGKESIRNRLANFAFLPSKESFVFLLGSHATLPCSVAPQANCPSARRVSAVSRHTDVFSNPGVNIKRKLNDRFLFFVLSCGLIAAAVFAQTLSLATGCWPLHLVSK